MTPPSPQTGVAQPRAGGTPRTGARGPEGSGRGDGMPPRLSQGLGGRAPGRRSARGSWGGSCGEPSAAVQPDHALRSGPMPATDRGPGIGPGDGGTVRRTAWNRVALAHSCGKGTRPLKSCGPARPCGLRPSGAGWKDEVTPSEGGRPSGVPPSTAPEPPRRRDGVRAQDPVAAAPPAPGTCGKGSCVTPSGRCRFRRQGAYGRCRGGRGGILGRRRDHRPPRGSPLPTTA